VEAGTPQYSRSFTHRCMHSNPAALAGAARCVGHCPAPPACSYQHCSGEAAWATAHMHNIAMKAFKESIRAMQHMLQQQTRATTKTADGQGRTGERCRLRCRVVVVGVGEHCLRPGGRVTGGETRGEAGALGRAGDVP
jgi:hypothetical protein